MQSVGWRCHLVLGMLVALPVLRQIKASQLQKSTGDFCFPFSFYSLIRLHFKDSAAARLECSVCFGPESWRQVLPGDGGGAREWPSNHVAILPASGDTKYGPKLRILQPGD